MKGFFLNVDRTTADELYSDISPEFLSLVLLEAVTNVIYNPGERHDIPVDDPETYCDNPDSHFEDSIQYLLSVLTDRARNDGILTDEQEYDMDSEQHIVLSYKLGEAMASIENANSMLDLYAIHNELEKTDKGGGLVFTTMHLNGKVFFTIKPKIEDAALLAML